MGMGGVFVFVCGQVQIQNSISKPKFKSQPKKSTPFESIPLKA